MKSKSVVIIFLAMFAMSPGSVSAQFRCGTAKDIVVRAIEGLEGGSDVANVDAGLKLIRQAENICPTEGDVWYYASLFEQKMAQLEATTITPEALRQRKAIADKDLLNATAFKSAALRDSLNPFTLAAPTPTDSLTALGPVQQKWALVVGVSKFKGKIDPLQFTSKDAKDLASTLRDPKYGHFQQDHVLLLVDEEATVSNIKAALNSIARQAGPSDLVLVFFATHGTARAQDSVEHLNYILAYDTKTNNEDALFGSALPMVEVSEIIRSRVQARRTVVLLDTCHSEGAGKSLVNAAAPSDGMMNSMKAGMGRAIIASSGQKQSSYESADLENGVFTHFFMEALKQKGGQMPLSDIFSYVSQEVPKHVQKELKAEQTPVMFHSDRGGEIVIGVLPQLPAVQATITGSN